VVTQVASASEQTAAISNRNRDAVANQQQETREIATAMNEMAATVQEVAQYAAQGAEAANQASEESNSGSAVVANAVDRIRELAAQVETAAQAISRLDEKSAAIGSVLDVIRGIAEQTNLLALNAAIEAARAGEQGRGFAVVADEVRALARRTSESTDQIQKTIEQLQQESGSTVSVMKHGQTIASEVVIEAGAAGDALVAIRQSVASINDMNIRIASAAEEQSSVADDMNRRIVTIADVAEQSASAAAETSQASAGLSELATELQTMVNRFKVA
ncbi:hypothetical protein LCGC14_2361420, partial [marine sediment metagenome]